VKDRRYTRYKICFPKIVMNPDGTYDLDMKDQDVTMNVQGRDIPYHMALKRRLYPDYFKILEETVKRKEAEWKAKQGDANV
ncbi:hypothetical protein, partial [Sharpea azabuensis]|uniref:hypothetical protein n=1 Tax=Sharpea azabuensis TaxID=322505 RepID=UPI002E8014E5